MTKRFLSLILALTMVVSMFAGISINASAASVSGTFKKYTAETDGALVEGDYLIVYDGKAMKAEVSSGRLAYGEVTATNDAIANPDESLVWHIAASDTYYTIYNESTKMYAASTGAKNKAQLLADGTNDMALWTATGTDTFELVNKANKAKNVNSNLRNNGTFGFACYATGTGGALTLYKLDADAPVCEHTNVTEIAAVAATCTTAGSEAGTKCADCGAILTGCTVIEALGHAWNEGEITTAATCTEDGVKTFACTREGCTETKTETVPATGHTYVNGVCSVCGEAEPAETTYKLVSDASTLKAGDVIVLASAAKNKAASAFAGKTFFNAVDVTIADGMFETSEAIEITLGGETGAWTLTTSEGGIGTSAAKALKLDDGTLTWTIEIDAATGAATIASTNTTLGRILYNNGATRFLNYTTATNASMLLPEIYIKTAACEHANVENVAEVPATCTKDGVEAGTKCADCGKILSGCAVIPATGHTYGEDGKCTVCGEAKPVVVSYVKVADLTGLNGKKVIIYNPKNAKAMTATANGSKLAAVDGTVAEDKLTADGAAALEVFMDGEYYYFKNEEGKYLTSGLTGNSLTFADASSDLAMWTIEAAATGYTLKNKAAVYGTSAQYLEYYSGFTTFSMKTAGDAYYFEFYAADNYQRTEDHTHTWNEGEVTTPATCTTAGVKTYTCTGEGCGETKTETIPALGHAFGEDGICANGCGLTLVTAGVTTLTDGAQIIIYNKAKNMVLSTAPAATTGYLTGIAAEADTTDSILKVSSDAAVFTVHVVETGYKFSVGDQYLTYGDDRTTLTMAADSDHAIWTLNESNNLVSVNSAYKFNNVAAVLYLNAYTGRGFTCYSTAKIDDAFVMAFYSTNATICEHTFEETSRTDATCTVPGQIVFTCTKCGASKTEAIAALGHEYGDFTVTKEATCTEAGSKTHSCTRTGCTASETVEIPALGHVDNDQNGKCDRCEAEVTLDLYTLTDTLTEGNAYVIVAKDADGKYWALVNTENGTGAVTTCVEVAVANNAVNNPDASVIFTAVSGTYTNNGTDFAGIAFAGPEKDKYLHLNNSKIRVTTSFQNGIFEAAAGTAEGAVSFLSTVNSKYLAFANGKFTVASEAADVYLFTKAPAAHEHVLTAVEAKAATCTEAGNEAYWTCECGKMFSDAEGTTEITVIPTIPATGHNYGEDGKCTVCGAEKPVDTLPGRYYIAAQVKNGNFWYMTSNLDAKSRYLALDSALTELPAEIAEPETDKVFVIEASGDNYVIKAYATGTYLALTNGLAETGETVTIVKDETTGAYAITSAADATKMLARNATATNKYFSWYNGQLTAIYLVPVTGDPVVHTHTLTAVEAKAATCVNAGYEAYWICECGKMFSDAEGTNEITKPVEIPATGEHTYVDGVCSVCGAVEPVASTATYTKVTSEPTDWSGKYLIVYENSETEAYVFNGTDGLSDYVTGTIANGKISGSNAIDALVMTIAKNEAGTAYTIMFGENYIGQTSDANGLKVTATAMDNAIALAEDGVNIVSGGAYLRFNANSGQMRFRYYKSTSYTGQKAIALYKLDTAVEPGAHTAAHFEGQAATCTSEGVCAYWYCAECLNDTTGEHYGKAYSDEAMTTVIENTVLAALGHDFTVAPETTDADHYLAPTCTDSGLVYNKCSRCDTWDTVGTELPALGHEYKYNVVAPTCTEDGYTEVTCARCDYSDMTDIKKALGHSDYQYTDNGDGTHKVTCGVCSEVITASEAHVYVEGTCPCGATETPVVPKDENLKFLNVSLSLQECIQFTYMAKYTGVLNNYDSYYVAFSRNDFKDGLVENQDSGYKYSTRYHCFSYSVWSMQMNDEITATLYGVKDGIVYEGETVVKSVRDYVEEKFSAVNEATKLVYANMLQYGAMAQVNFAYDTENLVTTGLRDEITAYITTEAPATVNQTAATNNGLTAVKLAQNALGTQDAVKLQYVLNIGTSDVNSLYAVATWVNEKGETVEKRYEGNQFTKQGKYYIVLVDGLNAVNGKVPVSLTVYDASTNAAVSETFTCSIQSQVYARQTATNNTTAKVNALNLMNALMNYYNACEALFG